MKFGKRFCQTLALVALGALVSTAATAQVTTRMVVPGGVATTSKTTPGGTATFEVRIDAPANATIGLAYRLVQTQPAPPPSSFFSITGRVDVGDPPAAPNPLYPYADQNSGQPNTIVLGAASALLDPDNNDNLGRNATNLVTGIPAASNILATTITMTAAPTTPLGTYRIQPTPGGTSAVTGDSASGFPDFDMSAAFFDIVVGQPLTVVMAASSGAPTGTVTSDVGAINCTFPVPGTGVCSDIYPGSTVTLTATPSGGSSFGGWSGGGCAGTGTCVVTVAAATSVTATFAGPVAPQTLTVTKSGTGTGTVTSVPAGINCGATCSFQFAGGTMVTLTATPIGTSTFAGWSGGGCSGTGTCVVTLAAATTVNAQFDPGPNLLTVTPAGTGTGVVTSAPAGINCPGTCSFTFPASTVVTLTAVANAGSGFSGWSGGVPACSGTGTCVVTMNQAQNVTATFDLPPVATITSGPPSPSNSPNPQFTFTSNVAGSTFQCQLDGGAIFACSSPTTVSVGNGNHSFVVRAIGPGNNVGAFSAPFLWTAAGIIIVSAIPTLNEWMLMLLALLVGSAGVLMSRRRKA